MLEKLQESDQIDFNRIASISKVLSFMYPEKYIIYDARVAYSLNWILLKSKASENFFPIPDTRNSKLHLILVEIHEMANTLIVADKIWGEVPITEDRIKRLFRRNSYT